MTIRVVTDSSAVMPPAWRARDALHVVPLEVVWADGTVGRGDLAFSDVADELARQPSPPKTAAPSPGSYEVLISQLLATSDGVLIVCPAADLSATYTSAVLGARATGSDNVRVLDARTAAAGQGLVAAEAARAAADGADLTAVTDRALAVANGVQVWATLAQLDHLRRSGRLPAIAAAGAGALGLQPVVRYAGGSPAPVGVVRSTARGTDRLIRAWERTLVHGRTVHAVVFHSARTGDAERIRDAVASRAPGADVHVTEVTSSLAAHTGPGLLGLAWFWDN